jgi:hypothetical protein
MSTTFLYSIDLLQSQDTDQTPNKLQIMQIVLVAIPGTSPETVAQAITANFHKSLSIFRSHMQSKTPGGSLQARPDLFRLQ